MATKKAVKKKATKKGTRRLPESLEQAPTPGAVRSEPGFRTETPSEITTLAVREHQERREEFLAEWDSKLRDLVSAAARSERVPLTASLDLEAMLWIIPVQGEKQ